jgi:hypothetical protein
MGRQFRPGVSGSQQGADLLFRNQFERVVHNRQEGQFDPAVIACLYAVESFHNRRRAAFAENIKVKGELGEARFDAEYKKLRPERITLTKSLTDLSQPPKKAKSSSRSGCLFSQEKIKFYY